MNCANLLRINGGRLQVVTGDDGSPREFADRDDAIFYTEGTSLLPESDDVDWRIVLLDEL